MRTVAAVVSAVIALAVCASVLVLIAAEHDTAWRGEDINVEIIALTRGEVNAYTVSLCYSSIVTPAVYTATGGTMTLGCGADCDSCVTLTGDAGGLNGDNLLKPLATVVFTPTGSGLAEFWGEAQFAGLGLQGVTRSEVMVYPGYCFGDFAPDWGFIDTADIMAMLPAWGSGCGDAEYSAVYDLDGDCRVGFSDVMAVVDRWNTACE